MKKCAVYLILFYFLTPTTIFAHQPNYINRQLVIANNEPNLSKAYYGELIGSRVIYSINATSSLKLYVQILSPQIQNSKRDFTVLIVDGNQKIIANLATSSDRWQSWYEDYGGDWYRRGPSFNQVLLAGKYNIIVSNSDNMGKYSLAIGEEESFPVNQFFHTIQELYSIKTKFFNEPWYGIFYGIIGKYLLLSSTVLVLILFLIVWISIHFLKNRHENRL